MSLSDAIIDTIVWSDVEVLNGSGQELANSLRRFVQAETREEVSSLWWELEGVAFAQNTIYGGAVQTIEVMMAALADQPADFLRPWIIEVVRFIITVRLTPIRRCFECMKKAERTWLLAAEVCQADASEYREAVLEVLTLLILVCNGCGNRQVRNEA